MKLGVTRSEVSLLVRLLSTALEDANTPDYTEALNRLQQKFIDLEEGAGEKKKRLRHTASALAQFAVDNPKVGKKLEDLIASFDAKADLEDACS